MSETKQVALRLEVSFHDKIQKLAKNESRSLHAQIVFILRAWFDKGMLRSRLDELEYRAD